MLKIVIVRAAVIAAAWFVVGLPASATDVDPCTRFTWNVTRELAVMTQTPKPVAVAVKTGADVPQLQFDTLYELKLAAQGATSFAIKPGKLTVDDSAHAGLVRFRTEKAGLYRISITSRHWLDVVDGAVVVKSRDFQGQRGCERPRKIVEYELPAGRDLTLQLSGSPDATVLVAITPAPSGS